MCIRDRSTNHSIKRVGIVEEKFNKSGQEEPSLLPAEMDEELAEGVQISIRTKEVIGKPTMGVETKLLLVSERPRVKWLKMRLRKRLLTEDQTDLDLSLIHI